MTNTNRQQGFIALTITFIILLLVISLSIMTGKVLVGEQRIAANEMRYREALANADSPTNLSWLINNSEIGSHGHKEEKPAEQPLEFSETNSNGTSFKEFTLSFEDAEGAEEHHGK